MKYVIFLCSLFLTAMTAAQNKDINLCSWHKNEKIKDSEYQPVKKSNILFFLSNNADNVYVNLKIPDKEIRKEILEKGLTIWIDMNDKKGMKMGVKYTSQTMKEPPYTKSGTIELIGFVTEQERHFAAENPDNFTASLETAVNGTVYFNLVMPVAKLPLRNAKDGHGAMQFSIGLETGYDDVFWINHVKLATSE